SGPTPPGRFGPRVAAHLGVDRTTEAGRPHPRVADHRPGAAEAAYLALPVLARDVRVVAAGHAVAEPARPGPGARGSGRARGLAPARGRARGDRGLGHADVLAAGR